MEVINFHPEVSVFSEQIYLETNFFFSDETFLYIDDKFCFSKQNMSTAWKVSKYGPEKTPYLYTLRSFLKNVTLFAFLGQSKEAISTRRAILNGTLHKMVYNDISTMDNNK